MYSPLTLAVFDKFHADVDGIFVPWELAGIICTVFLVIVIAIFLLGRSIIPDAFLRFLITIAAGWGIAHGLLITGRIAVKLNWLGTQIGEATGDINASQGIPEMLNLFVFWITGLGFVWTALQHCCPRRKSSATQKRSAQENIQGLHIQEIEEYMRNDASIPYLVESFFRKNRIRTSEQLKNAQSKYWIRASFLGMWYDLGHELTESQSNFQWRLSQLREYVSQINKRLEHFDQSFYEELGVIVQKIEAEDDDERT